MSLHLEHVEIPDEIRGLPEYRHAKAVILALESAGYEAYVVGGFVRDLILGRRPHDCDVCTSATPAQVKRAFSGYSDHAVVDVGIKYGTVSVVERRTGVSVEVTTYRSDGDYGDGRHPDGVSFGVGLEQDLLRRDFTMNALALDPYFNRVAALSPGDVLDARLGIIRCVGDPRKRFSEDALRMMRAIRFSAQLGFVIEAATVEAIRELAPSIAGVSAERMRDEITKILLSPHPEEMHRAWDYGLLRYHFPEYGFLVGCPQNNQWHRLDLEDHTFAVVNGVPPEPTLRWAALLHDIGKLGCRSFDAYGHAHFYRHPELSAQLAEGVCERLKLPTDARNKISLLCRTHDYLTTGEVGKMPTSAQVRRAVAAIGVENFPDWIKLRRADILGHSYYAMDDALAKLSGIVNEYEGILSSMDAITCKDLALDGNDVCSILSVEPGPIVGKALKAMLEAVLDDPAANTREGLTAALLAWYDNNKD